MALKEEAKQVLMP